MLGMNVEKFGWGFGVCRGVIYHALRRWGGYCATYRCRCRGNLYGCPFAVMFGCWGVARNALTSMCR
jgi:hypothetical protein